MYFADHILKFYSSLDKNWSLPDGISILFPFEDEQVKIVMSNFYYKYYSDQNPRYFLFGINPGRLGAGMTGIPFTDPIHLEEKCNIQHGIDRKHELSSLFIYEMIEYITTIEEFYNKFYISSICPLGFTKDGKNYNYYDDKVLFETVKPRIIESIKQQIEYYCEKDKAFSLGQGKNHKIFKALNDQHKWFGEIIPLPHPRWVMQYKRKNKSIFLDEFARKLEMF